MRYNKEDLECDEEWLRGFGVNTEEVTEFLINLITKGFSMTREEYVEFMKEVGENGN